MVNNKQMKKKRKETTPQNISISMKSNGNNIGFGVHRNVYKSWLC